MIRLKVVKVKNLASLVCGSPLGWARSSLQIFFLKVFFFQSNTVQHISGLERLFFVASVCHNMGFIYILALHQQVFRCSYASVAHRI